LFKPDAGDQVKAFATANVSARFDYVNEQLGDGPFLLGDTLTLPDAYLFVISGWAEKMLGGLGKWPNIDAFRQRMLQRPSVRHVLRFEGLLEEQSAG
jgi:glutathione S-transferase